MAHYQLRITHYALRIIPGGNPLWASFFTAAIVLWFDVCWCLDTTFTAFSMAETWVNALLLGVLLAMPLMLLRRRWLQASVWMLLALWCEVNLMYARTYFSAIPLSSYGLASNLADFMDAVWDSLRWADAGFVVIIGLGMWWLYGVFRPGQPRAGRASGASLPTGYWCALGALVAASVAMTMVRGGFRQAWADLENANYYSCRVPMYTLAGSLCHDALTASAELTPKDRREVKEWFKRQPPLDALPEGSRQIDNIVLVICESLESWPIGLGVEGKEVMPKLSALARDTVHNLYAPHILTQVGAGRSIDGQLLINAGLLPMKNGVYAMTHANNRYYTLNQALKEKNSARSYLLSVDKPVVWHQNAVAHAFGFDTLLCKDKWKADEVAGPRPKAGDRTFMRQIAQKMRQGDIWPEGTHAFVQIVTYSGHAPFQLPQALDRLHLKGNYPGIVADYLRTANYTDQGIGLLISYLRTRPDWERTMVVITGDHEGLAAHRSEAVRGAPFVSPRRHTPLLIVNAPLPGRVEHVAGQADIYPTLLRQAGMSSYCWHGMGVDLLSPRHPHAAIDPNGRIETDEGLALTDRARLRLCASRVIADRVIRHDLLR